MPGGDRTGPWGAGPRTGRGAGYCAGFRQPGYATPFIYGRGAGFGRGGGRGGGRGWRHWYYATGLPGWARTSGYGRGYAPGYEFDDVSGPEFSRKSDEAAYLRQEARNLEAALKDINKRIEEIEKK